MILAGVLTWRARDGDFILHRFLPTGSASTRIGEDFIVMLLSAPGSGATGNSLIY